jgi:pyruvate/2-oxoglutarate dehydrogenase complex dihydrolipoamide acyltransferase (E2) component
MIYKLVVPMVAEDVEEYRVLEWHGAPGQSFETGDLVVELETHKAVVEVRAGQPGVFRSNLIENGGWCRIKAPIGLFSDAQDEPLPEDVSEAVDLLVEFEVV